MILLHTPHSKWRVCDAQVIAPQLNQILSGFGKQAVFDLHRHFNNDFTRWKLKYPSQSGAYQFIPRSKYDIDEKGHIPQATRQLCKDAELPECVWEGRWPDG